MRHSALKHTVAVLRQVTGEKQSGFADIVGCSLSTIESVESCRQPLSRANGERIALETDVSLEWLMQNDTTKPIVDGEGKPYTKETYQHARVLSEAGKLFGENSTPLGEVHFGVPVLLASAFSMFIEAAQQGRFRLFFFRAAQGLRD